ncbi:MAG: redoxin domain-containing protein [Gammaproteobacteria bacterium]|nr:redoxin domain-containing protein [Gammaproteobacteria bacterium]
MKKPLSVLALQAIALSFVGCQLMPGTGLKPNEFVITGELVYFSETQYQEQDLDVKVIYGSEETGFEELVSGKLKNGKFKLRGTIEFPMDVTLSVLRGETEVGFFEFRLQPNSKTRVELLRAKGHSAIYLTDYDRLPKNSQRKFELSGNLNQFDSFDLELPYADIDCVRYDLDGTRKNISYGPVLLDEGKLSIEYDIDSPIFCWVSISEHSPHSTKVFLRLHAIIEPGVNYEIGTIGDTKDIVIVADREGGHSKLITDWKTDPEYLELLEQLQTALNSEDKTSQEIQSDREENVELTEETSASMFAVNNPPDDECKHVDLSIVPDDTVGDLPEPPAGYKQRLKILDKHIELISSFMQHDDDLQLAWLAYLVSDFEPHGYPHYDPFTIHVSYSYPHFDVVFYEDAFYGYEREPQQLTVLEEMASKFSPEFVDRQITPRIGGTFESLFFLNNHRVIPGRPAPLFTLSTQDDDSVSLGSVLQENELVLVNFWDSSCDPCLSSFPLLEEVYSTYRDQGFEIITVYTGELNHWQTGFDDSEFPWIDVIDSEGTVWAETGPIQTAYGVGDIYSNIYTLPGVVPDDYGITKVVSNGFLLDREGCIVQRDLSPAELENVLASHWSEESVE